MTKEEYTEFLSLQEHFEWLHAAEDRAKTKLETITTDDSEFDELVHEAIKVYFETEIDKAWKKIEEFKTAPTFVADRADAIRYCFENGTTNNKEFLSPAHNEILTFNIDGINVKLPRGDVWMARERCTGSCDLTTYCPFFGKPNIQVGDGCRRIFDACDAGKYTVSNGIFEEVDE